ncbi:unnamed protein product [Darwinula stevensoni]|uniref:RING-type domain-containing protein n=1 Tax=Darwinula stevensoni TaxID=69355 RepID=A0A7R8XDN8_9CRUS|nr:unnamed protein product [Darwinula stevensoni]CAG0894515.1 unnamed protein product [Darwinula stevensoni]
MDEDALEILEILPQVPLTIIYSTLGKYKNDPFRRDKALTYLLNEDLASSPEWLLAERQPHSAEKPSHAFADNIAGTSHSYGVWPVSLADSTSKSDNHPNKRPSTSVPEGRNPKEGRNDLDLIVPENANSMPDGQDLKRDQQLTLLLGMFPDCDPEYLKMKCDECNYCDNALQVVVQDMLDQQNYPHCKQAHLHKSLDLKSKYSDMSLHEFLDLVDDPLDFFYRTDRPATPAYVNLTTAYLKKNFPYHTVREIEKLMRENRSLLAPTVKAIRNGNFELRKTRRPASEVHEPHETDENFLKELTFLRFEAGIQDYFALQRDVRENEKREARKTGSLLECPICCDDELIYLDMEACPEGHTFCGSCVKRHVNEQVGQGRVDFPCLDVSCSALFDYRTLAKLMKPSVMSRILKQKQAEEIKAADIPCLECCPFCDFAMIVEDSNEKLFRCLNPECMKESCRLCKEPSHIPLRCDEVEKEAEVQARTYLENEMSESIIRECHKCHKRFMKEEGCNKMTCSCGASMCYVCKKPGVGYDHFRVYCGVILESSMHKKYEQGQQRQNKYS